MEWEQCKENIKPKREGRAIGSIITTPKGTPMMAQIQETQAEFERQIKEYEGDDELSVWVKYVKYMEDAFPEGDYLSNVGTLQFRMIKRFQEVERYKQDPRMLRIFLDLANHSINGSDVFAYCFHHNLTTTFSKFWVNWINCWIYKQRNDKALKICEMAIKIFRNTSTFRGMKVQIVHMMDKGKADNMIDGIEELRKAGAQLFKDKSQNQLPGPSKKDADSKQFSIFKDKNTADTVIPSMSTNPLETKVRNKENKVEPKKQRWKGLIPDTDSAAPAAKPFAIFEEVPEENERKTGAISNAFKSKKITSKTDSTVASSGAPVLTNTTNTTTTVAYHKSKVYPFTGEEWSFEELEAMKRYNAKVAKAESYDENDSNSSKRSLEENDDFFNSSSKRPCNKSSTASPLKSCLSTSRFSYTMSAIDDFSYEKSLMTSTKKISNDPDGDKSVMTPNYKDAEKQKQRSSLNLSARSESSLFTSDFKKPVEDSLKLASKRSEIVSDVDADDERDSSGDHDHDNLIDRDGPKDMTFKGLQAMIGIPQELDPQEGFAIYEDTIAREKNSEFKEPEIIKGAFTKKKLKFFSPAKSTAVDNKEAPFQVFGDEKKKNADGSFCENFDFGDLQNFQNFDGRPSDAFKIFKKTPEKSIEESYELVKVALTPVNNSKNSSFVPCTVDKMGARPRNSSTSDTQLISKQAMNLLNDCSAIEEAEETSKSVSQDEHQKPYKLSFDSNKSKVTDDAENDYKLSFDSNKSKVTDDAENYYKPSKSGPFQIFEESSKSKPFEIRQDEPFDDNHGFDKDDNNNSHRNQLTPILEGSREASSLELGRTQNLTRGALADLESEMTTNVSAYSYVDKLSSTRHDNLTRRSFEPTVAVRITRGENTSSKDSESGEDDDRVEHYPLVPDKNNKDIPLGCAFLLRVPRTSLAPQQPVQDPYDQTLIESLVQSLNPPLFFCPNFNQHDSKLVPAREVDLGRLHVSNITRIGEGAFAKVYSGDCVDEESGRTETLAFKIQSPPCPWEFYILTELKDRMGRDEISYDVYDMILPTRSIHVYQNSSVLVTSLFNEGSLLDMINHYLHHKRSVPEAVICVYTLDILRCVDAIHRSQIIHGDIKPDNMLLRDKENTMHSMTMKLTKSIVLIDFGRSVDMKLLPAGSQFTVKSNTELFECVEMQTGRPWTYQVDYYGMLSCIHLMIHGQYMKVLQDKVSGVWKPDKKPHRRVNQELYGEMFTELMNISDCESIPPLSRYITLFEEYLSGIKTQEKHQQLKTHYLFMSQLQR